MLNDLMEKRKKILAESEEHKNRRNELNAAASKFARERNTLNNQTREFVEEAQIIGKTLREGWKNFMENQLEKFHGFRAMLDKNYSDDQIDEVVQAALATGKAIKDFYAKRMAN